MHDVMTNVLGLMLRKILLICLAILLLAVPSVQAQTRTVFWEEWNVLIDNIDTTANRFDVQEFYDVYFTGTFRFGQRIVDDTNLSAITDVSVSENGVPLERSCSEQPGTFCVQNVVEGVSITYHFRQPITDANQNFTIDYTIEGALRIYEGGDQLWWQAIPPEHFGFPIRNSEIVVEMPDGFAPRPEIDPVVTYGVTGDVSVENGTVRAVATEQIGGNDFFEIRVQYPHDPNAVTPVWQSDFDSQRAFEENVQPWISLGLIALSLLVGLGIPLLVFSRWYTKGRDPQVGPVPEYLSEPPSELPPAVVGTLLDEKVDMHDILATLIDLATRGYVVFEESKSGGIFGFGQSSEFTFKRTDKSLSDLLEFEKTFANAVFAGSLQREMDDLKNKFYKKLPDLQTDLYDELVKRQLFDHKPNTTRTIWTVIGQVIMVGGIALGFLLFGSIDQFGGALLCLPGALVVAGILTTFVGQYMPAKTRQGALEAEKWRAFRTYMENLEKYDDVETASARFNEYLPYAVAFGFERAWIRRFSKVPNLGIPIWYYPTYRGGYYSGGYRSGSPLPQTSSLPSGSDVLPGELARAGTGGLEGMSDTLAGGLESISDGLTDMLDSASRTFTSKPQSSSSGSWSGGGGSFSGGGSFGGGSSGGGSSGFG